jgi:rubrerythrin
MGDGVMTNKRHWTLDDIPWDRFDHARVDPDILKVVKAAALVEFNANDYATYLRNVFGDDAEFQAASTLWAHEEVQHGQALGRWAMMADPAFKFAEATARFGAMYRINLEADASTRGSRAGELIARCMVETGTSSYYAALGEAAEEPVLKAICQRIAADELRHYKLFYTHLKAYLKHEDISTLRRLRIAFGRIAETEDDELACAYYAANAGPNDPYVHAQYSREYMRRAYSYYRHHHLERVVGMIFKACGLRPQTPLFRVSQRIAWWLFTKRATQLQKAAA